MCHCTEYQIIDKLKDYDLETWFFCILIQVYLFEVFELILLTVLDLDMGENPGAPRLEWSIRAL